MANNNKYVRAWQDAILEMSKAIKAKDFHMADSCLAESQAAYGKFKACTQFVEENRLKSFGELNHLFEEAATDLFQNNKAALKEIVNIIKEDKNLLGQYRFIDSLRKFSGEDGVKEYVAEAFDLASKTINRATLKESKRKLADALTKYEIGLGRIDENQRRFFENCETLMEKKSQLSNLMERRSSVNVICEWVENHKALVTEDKSGEYKTLVEELDRRMANLSEEERGIVQDIIAWKKPIAEARKEKLFNKFKNECIKKVDVLIAETKDSDDKAGYESIKQQLVDKEYCAETVIKDMAKLLEIRDVLMEK